ncbi:MAG: lipocalin family protein [Lewinellaceae bacterium]|nr:lipocalin family protein [Lewinellaceae bacterium]
MKTVLSKINLTAIALFMLLLPGLTSCNKDDKDDNPAPGTGFEAKWEVNSFTIDGVEVKGLIINKSHIEFEEKSNSAGSFSWVITYNDNTSDTVTGDYLLNDSGNKITLDSRGDETLEFDIELSGDTLELSGEMDGSQIVVKADRK